MGSEEGGEKLREFADKQSAMFHHGEYDLLKHPWTINLIGGMCYSHRDARSSDGRQSDQRHDEGPSHSRDQTEMIDANSELVV